MSGLDVLDLSFPDSVVKRLGEEITLLSMT